MTKWYCCFWLFLLSIGLSAQQEAEPLYKKQIGVDITGLLTQVFNFSSTQQFNDPVYIFSYKKMQEKGRFRLGLGGDFVIDGVPDDVDTDFRINFRAGKEKFTELGPRWTVFYGGDYKLNFSYTSFGGSDNSLLIFSTGGGPICGIQFNISPRLSLSTEAGYDFMLLVKNQLGETTFGAFSSFSIPDFLYLNFDF